MRELVNAIRPKKSWLGRKLVEHEEDENSASKKFHLLITILKNDAAVAPVLKQYLERELQAFNHIIPYTQAGILSNKGFFPELWAKVYAKFLPPLVQEDDLRFWIETVFYQNDDYIWLAEIGENQWLEFFELLKLGDRNADTTVIGYMREQLLNSIMVLSHRLTTLGMEPDIVARVPDLEELKSPFLEQNNILTLYINRLREGAGAEADNQEYVGSLIALDQCEERVRYLRDNRDKIGASLGLTYMIQRAIQHVRRIKELLALLHLDGEVSKLRIVQFFVELVKASNRRNSIRRHINSNISLLAYQVVEHTSHTGDHYITRTRKEFWKFLFSSMGGGAIVGILVPFKLLAYYLHLPLLGQAFVYSMNYSLGFIGIHLTKSTLATKQPAMTASKIAASLDGELDAETGERTIDLIGLTEMITRVSRSQLVSFLGNVMISLPVAMLFSMAYRWYHGIQIADQNKAWQLIEELHPLESNSILYASIAGVYLFISGLISGYYDNQVVYNQLSARLQRHKLLLMVKEKWRFKIINYLEHNMGALAGNFFLGIFLGSTSVIGKIIGLPLDIRHITFAAGNLGLSLVSLEFNVSWEVVLTTLAGIACIGLFNFLISFGLALFTATRSRALNFAYGGLLLRFLYFWFIYYPTDFFFPPKEARDTSFLEPVLDRWERKQGRKRSRFRLPNLNRS